MPLADIADKGGIEPCVMRRQNRILSAEFHEIPQCFCFLRCIFYHSIGNTSQIYDFRRNRTFRIYHGIKRFYNLHAPHANRADFSQAILCRAESSCLYIKDNDLIL